MIKDIIHNNEGMTPVDREFAVLRAAFPACFHSDGSFDFARFKEYLNDKVSVVNEGYGLHFLGKNYARLLASLETTTVIVPDEEHNALPENRDSRNIYISGDNLDALKHLLHSYEGSIKCIYIDPPYNTGTDGFVYNDNFKFTPEYLSERLSIDEDEAARILDMTRRGAASHSAWLTFMLPRLELARDLLSDDGVIFISIDDNEQANLKLLCDEVFGEENFVGQLILKTATDNNPSQINTEHEYMLCFARNKDVQTNWMRRSEAADLLIRQYNTLRKNCKDTKEIQAELRKWININKAKIPQVAHYNNVDENGVYSSSSNSSNPHPGGYVFDIIHPVTGQPCPKPTNGWRWPEKTFKEYEAKGLVEWGKDHTTQPHIKKRLETSVEYLRSIIYEDNRGTTKMLADLFDGYKVFDNPKPVNVLSAVIDFVTDEDDIILDFFSGSATTAHAVMSLNNSHGSNRKFIMVQIQEKVKDGHPANAFNFSTIDEIGIERIKRAAKKIKAENPLFHGDLGFKHYTLKEPESKLIDQIEDFDTTTNDTFLMDTLLNEFGVPTVLSTWLVRDGYGLTDNAKELDLAGYKAYYKDRHLYLLHSGLSDAAVDALVTKYESDKDFNPLNVVIFGYSFNWTEMETLKVNLRRLQATEKNLRLNFDVRY